MRRAVRCGSAEVQVIHILVYERRGRLSVGTQMALFLSGESAGMLSARRRIFMAARPMQNKSEHSVPLQPKKKTPISVFCNSSKAKN